ncbi:ion transporter [Novosphingobium sp. 1949]|uniref:Ion transporter n=1 Tax=Novosphingobium organovorum TaxID=2930092 RepID=A0ABT0BDH1_9SPHN|nr:ion transporter [Novosphingobium organovorum]MCJ2183077.1 ion transporter [Novosphingobium organovorum]
MVYRIAFETDTTTGRLFEKVLIAAIVLSVLVVIADSIPTLHAHWYFAFTLAEWVFTALFTLEYVLRIVCLRAPFRYARSFFGIVDLLALLPTYLALLFPAIHVLIDVRVLRLLRIFRVFKLTAYISEYQQLGHALAASRRKIAVFLASVVLIVVVLGSLMYVLEGPEHGFTSIPVSIYWAITTMTTVGYGDITPQSPLGRFVTALMMLLGWGTLAVPTGIVTSEIAFRQAREEEAGHPQAHGLATLHLSGCAACGEAHHLPEARHCHACGARLPRVAPSAK